MKELPVTLTLQMLHRALLSKTFHQRSELCQTLTT